MCHQQQLLVGELEITTMMVTNEVDMPQFDDLADVAVCW
jgi:hypothetical protein